MDITKKIIACAAAFTMLIGGTSCSKDKDEDEHHDHNIVEDDIAADANVSADNMPFGANEVIMSSDDSGNVPITICYDDRYITDTEAAMISKYFSALNNNDLTMFSEVIYAPYLSAIMSSAGINSSEEYLQEQNKSLTNTLGDGFLFDYIYFKDGLFSGDYDFSDFDAVVYANEPSAQITDRKLLTAEVEYTNSLSNNSYVTDINVCLYTIDGVPYILR